MLKLLTLLFTGAKLGKLLLTGGTMLVSVFAYSFVFGWPYAAGFVLLILVHELGHFIAARKSGLDVGAPTFIPFVGAWIEMKEMPRNAQVEAYVGLAGPVAGTLGALACYYAGRHFDSNLLLALSYAGFFLNLFNLIPLSPFDGGRITAAISPRIWLVGVPVLVGLFIYNPSPMLVLMALLAAPGAWKAWRFRADDPEHGDYYTVSSETRFSYGLAYIGLLGFLAIMTHDLHLLLGSLRS